MKQKNLAENLQDLPKWAQLEIKVLQMRLNEAKDELYRINDNPKSNTIIGTQYGFQGEQIKYLKDNQQITFMFGEKYITARVVGDFLDIMTQGPEDLYIRPKVSNSIELHFKP